MQQGEMRSNTHTRTRLQAEEPASRNVATRIHTYMNTEYFEITLKENSRAFVTDPQHRSKLFFIFITARNKY